MKATGYLRRTTAIVPVFILLSASATVAQRPSAPGDPADVAAEIVVTGTSIKGVAPVGSNLVSVGRDLLSKTAAISATDLTNTVPAITTSGSASVGENVFSYFSPQIHSLAGSASNTTLVIVDGLRMPGGGTQYAQTDPNIIPTSAIQRVEVLADGASSVYGSDAVAGVVNYITRRTFDGIEVQGKHGFADKWHSWDGNGIVGKTWETGGAYIAAQYSFQSPLHNNSRDFLSMGDYRPNGGRNVNSFACSPATIRTPASGNNTYLTPGSTAAVANVANNAPCNLSVYGDAIQSNERATVLARATNTFGRLTVTTTINYNRLRGSRNVQPGTITSVTAFGPGSGKGGQINPFYLAPAGEPGATQELLTYAALRPDNRYGIQSSTNDTFYAYGTAEYEVTDKASIKLSNAYGHSVSHLDQFGVFCTSCAYLALNGTSTTGGSTTASNVAGQNVVTLNLPLTTANALDVWRANGGNTSPSVFNNLYSNNTSLVHTNNFYQAKLEGQAELFNLPAGAVRMAVGGEFMTSSQKVDSVDPQNTLNTSKGATFITYLLKRKVWSAYGELVIPIVSEEMTVPLVRGFTLNVSGRYDHYDDVGGTSNPKVAANWEITRGLRLRGNYATAFVAPPLAAIGVPSLGYQRTATGAGVSGALFVPVSLYPEVLGLPGCAGATSTCQIGTAVSQGLSRSYGVGAGAKPQTGNSWSAGIDLNPVFLKGFSANVTFWSNVFKGGVNRPDVTQQLYSAALHNRLTICPSGCTGAQIDAFTNVANGGTLSGTLPSTVYFLVNNDSGNLLNLHVQGIDFSATYQFSTAHLGSFTVGGSGTYYTRFKQDFGDTPFSVLNTSGFNSTFPSIQKRFRFQGGWALDAVSIDVFANYTGKYRNWSNGSINPVTTTVAGIPNGGGDIVGANTTIDLHAEYQLGFGILKKGALYVDVKNLFDKDPPFYSGNVGGIGVGGYGYNAYVSNPIGRIVSVGFRADF